MSLNKAIYRKRQMTLITLAFKIRYIMHVQGSRSAFYPATYVFRLINCNIDKILFIWLLKCMCIEIFDDFLLANMKDHLNRKRKLFTVC